MWFKVRRTATRSHPYEKPQEGQKHRDRKSTSSCQVSAPAGKSITEPRWTDSPMRSWQRNISFPLVLLLLMVVILQNKPPSHPKIHLSSQSLSLNTRLAPHKYNGQKHSSHVPSVHTETHKWNQWYSQGRGRHSDSSRNKKLWNGKSTMHSNSRLRLLDNTTLKINYMDRDILKWSKWKAKKKRMGAYML